MGKKPMLKKLLDSSLSSHRRPKCSTSYNCNITQILPSLSLIVAITNWLQAKPSQALGPQRAHLVRPHGFHSA